MPNNNTQFMGINAKRSKLLLVGGYLAMGMISTVQLTADACVRVVDCLCVLSRIHVIDDNSVDIVSFSLRMTLLIIISSLLFVFGK